MLRAFSSNFFLVTRFLPPGKRAEVEILYAAVRYPDEIVDTFPGTADEKLALLDRWEWHYWQALRLPGIKERAARGHPWILCGFAQLILRRGIPERHYRSFLDAMRCDARPRAFADLDDLIDSYVYGSAIVVGYFLTYIYGAAPGLPLEEAFRVARELGIALQLTNFARDLEEDGRRGRLYLPGPIRARCGLRIGSPGSAAHPHALEEASRWLAQQAEPRYEYARQRLHVFAPDCRTAIRACLDVYGELNRRLLAGAIRSRRRVRLSALEKFRLLPTEKYWRLPLACARLL
ncbi:MAG: squalene/phytoene synthase family protein [Bryobacteraceae bacterium]|nr:squalene/phytoene synthase family protein [Bryobacteraceae bacterium]